jgi:hypothetical protein
LKELFNLKYGGKHPLVRNVITTQGALDPWRVYGITEDINESSPTFVIPGELLVVSSTFCVNERFTIPGGSHCSDMKSIKEEDSDELIAVKLKVFGFVKKWLGI